MGRIPRITARDLIAFLERLGFIKVRQTGSHMIYKNSSGIRVNVPYHSGKIIHPKIINVILKDLNMNHDEFIKLLYK